MKIRALTMALAILTVAAAHCLFADEPAHQHGDDMKDCPMNPDRAAGVDDRGDTGMGFPHTKTTHHFRLKTDGGAIEVTANDANDQVSRDQIRGHLAHIASLFGQGNFEIPMFVHAQKPPGAEVMERMKSSIGYRYEEMETGGRVLISTTDPQALQAIHDFLRFQITEHRTGDPMEVGGKEEGRRKN
jgi:hypothetical protein